MQTKRLINSGSVDNLAGLYAKNIRDNANESPEVMSNSVLSIFKHNLDKADFFYQK